MALLLYWPLQPEGYWLQQRKKQAQTPASDAVDVQARRIQQKLPVIDVRQKNRNYIL